MGIQYLCLILHFLFLYIYGFYSVLDLAKKYSLFPTLHPLSSALSPPCLSLITSFPSVAWWDLYYLPATLLLPPSSYLSLRTPAPAHSVEATEVYTHAALYLGSHTLTYSALLLSLEVDIYSSIHNTPHI
mgnify:FL=1